MKCFLSAGLLAFATMTVFTQPVSAREPDIWDDIEFRYVVEIKWTYQDYVEKPASMWIPEFTTTSYDDATEMYELLALALEMGVLKEIIDPVSFYSASDVRIRTEYWMVNRPKKLRPKTVSKFSQDEPKPIPLPGLSSHIGNDIRL